MTEEAPQSSPKPRLSKKLILLVPLGAIAVIAAIFVLIFHKPPNHYKYNQLDSYTLSGGTDGSHMIFKKPIEDKNIVKGDKSVIMFDHVGTTYRYASYISAAVVPLLHPVDDASLSSYDKVMGNSKDRYYSQTTASIKKFVNESVISGANITYANAKKFTNSNITKHTWQLDYTVSAPKALTKQIKGTALIAIGNKGYYFFNIYMPDNDWNLNKEALQQILDSIKIDQ